jgi:probable addiction module antidote protein
MNKRSKSFMSLLLDDLADPAEAAAYLSAAWEDSTPMFLTAVKDVLQARKIATVARTSDVRREHLYRAFRTDGNPTIATLRSVLHAVGLDFPGISTLREIEAAASSTPAASYATTKRRAAKSHRTTSPKNAAQFTLQFEGSMVAAQIGQGAPVAPQEASVNFLKTTVDSPKRVPQVPQQNQQSTIPPAWLISQFSAGAPSMVSEIKGGE